MTGIRTGMIQCFSLLMLICVTAEAQDSAPSPGWKVRALPASGPFFEPPGVPPEPSLSAESSLSRTIEVAEPGSSLDIRLLEKERRFRRLQGQIRALLDGWDEKGQRNPATSGTGAAGTGDPGEGGSAPKPDATSEDPANGNPETTPSDNTGRVPGDNAGTIHSAFPSAAAGGDSAAGSSSQSGSTATSPEFLNVRSAVIDGPIDRLALANNLYATGQITLALEMYEQIDQTVLSMQDRHWIEYQVACCLRRLKRIAEAQTHYRRLAAQPEARLLNEMSRWWLDRIADRLALESDLQKLQMKIDSVKEAQRGHISAK